MFLRYFSLSELIEAVMSAKDYREFWGSIGRKINSRLK